MEQTDSAHGDDATAVTTTHPYDPADYRWVPVRRKPRLDGWTEEKQRRFIEELADTGIVRVAAKAVGMTPQSAYRLRRSPDGAAFARAWDIARQHAGALLEDIAFERAIEGVEQNIFDEHGTVVCTKRVVNDRLLTFLLAHLKPDRYGRDARRAGADAADAAARNTETAVDSIVTQTVSLADSLRAMEPQLPAPAEQLLDPATLAAELALADMADGELPHFFNEQRPEPSKAQVAAAERAAVAARGEAALAKLDRKQGPLTDQEFNDLSLYLDPTQRKPLGKKRFR
jgi:hypothetical protein